MVQTLCHLLECLLTEENIPADCPKETYELYFVFAAIWAFGGAIIQDQVRGCVEVDTHIQVHSGKNQSSSKEVKDRTAKCQNSQENINLFRCLPIALLKTLAPMEGPYDVRHEIGRYLELLLFELVAVSLISRRGAVFEFEQLEV